VCRYGILVSALLPLVFLVVVKYQTQEWQGLQQHLEESRTVMLHNIDTDNVTEATIRYRI
jgi:hypothetical protein